MRLAYKLGLSLGDRNNLCFPVAGGPAFLLLYSADESSPRHIAANFRRPPGFSPLLFRDIRREYGKVGQL